MWRWFKREKTTCDTLKCVPSTSKHETMNSNYLFPYTRCYLSSPDGCLGVTIPTQGEGALWTYMHMSLDCLMNQPLGLYQGNTMNIGEYKGMEWVLCPRIDQWNGVATTEMSQEYNSIFADKIWPGNFISQNYPTPEGKLQTLLHAFYNLPWLGPKLMTCGVGSANLRYLFFSHWIMIQCVCGAFMAYNIIQYLSSSRLSLFLWSFEPTSVIRIHW